MDKSLAPGTLRVGQGEGIKDLVSETTERELGGGYALQPSPEEKMPYGAMHKLAFHLATLKKDVESTATIAGL